MNKEEKRIMFHRLIDEARDIVKDTSEMEDTAFLAIYWDGDRIRTAGMWKDGDMSDVLVKVGVESEEWGKTIGLAACIALDFLAEEKETTK